MKFAVFGGDGRIVRLSRLLREAGHSVAPCCLENAMECVRYDEALDGADCVILPVPCCRGDMLNAPYCPRAVKIDEILTRIPRGTPVAAGMAGSIAGACESLGLRLCDYFRREEFAVRNAALTAEGAAELLLRRSDRGLCGERILLCGFGRIGRLLALRLLPFGARVTVLARSHTDLAWARALGCEALDLHSHVCTEPYAFVVNTIPATVFGEGELRSFGTAQLIELASAPYGFDPDAAARLGLSIELAGGLPGKCAPEAAAEIIRDTIFNILEELH